MTAATTLRSRTKARPRVSDQLRAHSEEQARQRDNEFSELIALILKLLQMEKRELPASVDPSWFESLGDGPIVDPPEGVILMPAQWKAFDLVAAMDDTIPTYPD